MSDPSTSSSVVIFQRQVLLVVATVVLVLGAWHAMDVLLLIFGGILMAVFLRGLADLLSHYTKLPGGWSLGVVLLVLTAMVVTGTWYFAAEIASQFDQLSSKLSEGWENLRARLSEYGWGRQILSKTPLAQEGSGESGSGPDILGGMTMVLTSGLGAVANLVIILFIGIYVAMSPDLYHRGLLHLIPLDRRDRAGVVLDTLAVTLQWWIIGRLVSMTFVGVTIAIGLLILGTPLPLALAFIAFVLGFIPYIGPIIAVVPALAVAFMQSPADALYVGILYFVIESAESYLITPLVQQKSVELPPALTLSVQALMGVLMGVMGIVFATPLAAAGLVIVKMLYVQDVLKAPVEVAAQAQVKSDSP